MTAADAVLLAINLLRDAAESRQMPSGLKLDQTAAELHSDAAEVLQAFMDGLADHD